jgi:hypothetical protein
MMSATFRPALGSANSIHFCLLRSFFRVHLHVAGHIEVRIKRAVECKESFGFPGTNVLVIVKGTSREMYVVMAMRTSVRR